MAVIPVTFCPTGERHGSGLELGYDTAGEPVDPIRMILPA
jgi:hypothetical protein